MILIGNLTISTLRQKIWNTNAQQDRGLFLKLIGKADQVEGYDATKHKTVIFYVNTNSAVRWLHRHGLTRVDPFQDPGHAPNIKGALSTFSEIHELSKK
ncbi:MAG: hypothetical protein HWD61_10220 [Parachlamydiaceae bacterium]|nr:MAG: hypothetical protein HWD61_10220 [Parachlamydiaceae bacterium]